MNRWLIAHVLLLSLGCSGPLVTGAVREPATRVRPLPPVACLARSGGDLEVSCPPVERDLSNVMRLRADVEGMLSSGNTRTWVGPLVPDYIPLLDGTRELFVLDRIETSSEAGYLAFYRDPYDASSCLLGGSDTNCGFTLRFFDGHQGALVWELNLNDHLSRREGLEIQDVRYVDGTVYFNEACQIWEAQGCGALVAMEPRSGRLLWRSPANVSSTQFVVLEDHILTTFGTSSDTDAVLLVERNTGRVVTQQPVPDDVARFVQEVDGTWTAFLFQHTSEVSSVRIEVDEVRQRLSVMP